MSRGHVLSVVDMLVNAVGKRPSRSGRWQAAFVLVLVTVVCREAAAAGADSLHGHESDGAAEEQGEEGDPRAAATPSAGVPTPRIDIPSQYGYDILDPTTNINRKQLLILQRKQEGVLVPDTLRMQAAITTVANYQASNKGNKFGYIMRHPTVANEVGTTVSEAAVHSLQLGFTGMLGDWITAGAEILYDPEQSFGPGTNTALARNQLQARRVYALLGNLDRWPIYVGLGKMAVPFGLTDTVSPFTASSVWHAFGGLANGVTVGYMTKGLNLSIMGIQGGAQFRAAHAPVRQTSVPSRLNNFAVDASYSVNPTPAAVLLLGGSYQHGTAYCQGFPVTHFGSCRDNNPAFGLYGRATYRGFTLKGELARTANAWPGTFNPGMPEFAASRVTAFDVGAKYRHARGDGPIDFSVEFSRFDAGPDGAPWEDQDQLVLGVAWFARPSAKLFAEYVRVKGYAPLNFISGGNITTKNGEVMPDRTHSDRSARCSVLILGLNLAF